MTLHPLPDHLRLPHWIGIRRPCWKRNTLKVWHVHDLLYVAVDLTMVLFPASEELEHRRRIDLVQDGVGYRYVDTRWYGWLLRRVRLAERMCSEGTLPSAKLALILSRWAMIAAWAEQHIPAEQRLRAEHWHPGPEYLLPGRAA